ncbi:PadR family transcriptional regulator [Labedella gwakjiensis]|uniref:PadR family transcriptional regulator n=1 Tax=Labedella gwakjiensis TaxID=390269 RepID=A0A2P8GSL2_9MICO|nr:PadR family transcriptional regulator [Labedella gwakjiensis]PSL36942.1 PadR family transcriptional regulator [Labedella gwakjiensis]RUQ81754.1 PadR family transcriptional regulator [Labedella gwakjiensis]
MTPPVFSHGSLRLYLLKLLDEAPRHGYELIQALSERFGGTYSPSAGTIYPRLAKLEEEGLVTKASDGRKTVYRITDAGRAELRARGEELGRVESEVTDSVRRLAHEVRSDVTAAMRSLKADLASAARDARQSASRVPPVAPTQPDDRTSSRLALQEAELALNAFRHDTRASLRTHIASGGSFTSAQLADLRAELERSTEAVRRLLNP